MSRSSVRCGEENDAEIYMRINMTWALRLGGRGGNASACGEDGKKKPDISDMNCAVVSSRIPEFVAFAGISLRRTQRQQLKFFLNSASWYLLFWLA